MADIKSDFCGASQKATALKKTTSKLAQTILVVNDNQTTISGNINAQEAIQQAQETARQVAEAVTAASSNLQSVAEEFQVLDQQVGQNFLQSLGGLK